MTGRIQTPLASNRLSALALAASRLGSRGFPPHPTPRHTQRREGAAVFGRVERLMVAQSCVCVCVCASVHHVVPGRLGSPVVVVVVVVVVALPC